MVALTEVGRVALVLPVWALDGSSLMFLSSDDSRAEVKVVPVAPRGAGSTAIEAGDYSDSNSPNVFDYQRASWQRLAP